MKAAKRAERIAAAGAGDGSLELIAGFRRAEADDSDELSAAECSSARPSADANAEANAIQANHKAPPAGPSTQAEGFVALFAKHLQASADPSGTLQHLEEAAAAQEAQYFADLKLKDPRTMASKDPAGFEFPRALKVNKYMVEAIEKTQVVMHQTVPDVQDTRPLRDQLAESIIEAAFLSSLLEQLGKHGEKITPQELDAKHVNINCRYNELMRKHEDFKEKVAQVSKPSSSGVKRLPTDDDVPEPEPECPDTLQSMPPDDGVFGNVDPSDSDSQDPFDGIKEQNPFKRGKVWES